MRHAASQDEEFLNTITPRSRSPLRFFLLVFALTIPFWLLGAIVGYQILPGVPVSAFMFVCPVTAAGDCRKDKGIVPDGLSGA
jgi:hypothetical protein